MKEYTIYQLLVEAPHSGYPAGKIGQTMRLEGRMWQHFKSYDVIEGVHYRILDIMYGTLKEARALERRYVLDYDVYDGDRPEVLAERNRATHTGSKRSDVTRSKIRASNRAANGKPIDVYRDGILLQSGVYVRDWCEQMNFAPSALKKVYECARGVRTSYRGYVIRYASIASS